MTEVHLRNRRTLTGRASDYRVDVLKGQSTRVLKGQYIRKHEAQKHWHFCDKTKMSSIV